MPSKPSTKKFWKCPKGCKPPTKKNPVPCPHLEALLPAVGTGEGEIASHYQIEQTGVMHPQVDNEIRSLYPQYTVDLVTAPNEERLIEELRRFKVNESGIEIIVDRFVNDKSFASIARERGYTDRWAPKRHLKALKKELRAKGFGLKKKQGSET